MFDGYVQIFLCPFTSVDVLVYLFRARNVANVLCVLVLLCCAFMFRWLYSVCSNAVWKDR